MRGDRPDCGPSCKTEVTFTPHARGSTSHPPAPPKAQDVYPACAGIDHRDIVLNAAAYRLPRMRGDRPQKCCQRSYQNSFTPHARGSTSPYRLSRPARSVYPACAGIDLILRTRTLSPSGLPRMRGDRPNIFILFSSFVLFTPHARGSTPMWT